MIIHEKYMYRNRLGLYHINDLYKKRGIKKSMTEKKIKTRLGASARLRGDDP